VARNVKFLSSLQKESQSGARIVLERTDLRGDQVEDSIIEDLTVDPEKCTKQPVLTVARNVKFLSSLQKAEMFFAMNVLLKRKKNFK
jgi:hypothetical protein